MIILFPDRKSVIFISVGALMMIGIYIFLKRKKIVSTYNWIKVPAKVIKVNILQSKCPVLECFCFHNKPYRIDVMYKYDYEKKPYTSNQYAIDQICNYHYTLAEAKEIQKTFNTSKKIDIYINPKKPYQSVILRGMSKDFFPSYLFVFLVYGFLFYAIMLMKI
jgi:hypothetical protein